MEAPHREVVILFHVTTAATLLKNDVKSANNVIREILYKGKDQIA